MIEAYLFINPLDEGSLNLEKKFIELAAVGANHIQQKWIPVLNPQILHRYLLENHLQNKGLDYRNWLFDLLYSTCLDFKTAQLQGQAVARTFLMTLQERVLTDGLTYSDELVESVLADCNIDLPNFIDDRKSQLVIDFFNKDQQIAREMKIERFSSAVIFNYDNNDEYGILLDDQVPDECLIDLLITPGFSNVSGLVSNNHLSRYYYLQK
ncbi:DsbA family protein [Vagococcus vulneris]|nr:DsbA family protein [Vagococcus vulneris]